MSELVKVGIFWAVPNGLGGQSALEVSKNFLKIEADKRGFINYPNSHFEVWEDEMKELGDDCYKHPRGRVIFDTNRNRYLIYADECVSAEVIDEIVKLYGIEDYELRRDEHYVCPHCENTMFNLKYNILRGKDKIGENLIEISYGKTKILVELGKALDGDDKLSDMERGVLETDYNAVIVSHYHADHAGLISYKSDCPVYIGSGAYRIIEAMCEYHGEAVAGNVTTYRNGKAFNVGGIKITPFLCDHSAYDSYMLLFEAGGKSILYTGDFRFHGRKEKEKLLSRLPSKVNTLICEGTNIKSDKQCFSESELENKAVDIIKGSDRPVFILQSASNIDRLVSFYRASKRSGRVFYEDNYTALLASAACGSIPRPDVFKDVIAFTPRPVRGKRKDMFFGFKNKCGMGRIAENSRFVMLVRPSMLGYLKKLSDKTDLSGAVLIYSMWNGYKDKAEMKEFLGGIEKLGMQIRTLHTSGHASQKDIELLKQTVSAENYITVHTDSA